MKCHACNSRTQLQRSAVNTSTFAISNWTRHIKNCSMLHSHPGSRTRPIYSYLSPPLSSSTAHTSGGETFEQNSQLPLTGDNGDVASGGNEVANKPLEDSADVGPNVPNATLDTQGIAGDNHTGLLLEESVPNDPEKVADQNQNESEQIFPEAPLLKRSKRGAILDSNSRLSRQMRALEKAQSSSNQTRLDDFFSLLDEVEVICLKNEKLTSLLKQSNSGFNYELYSPILRQITCNAEKNARSSKHGYRHADIVKKFATALFIYSGPLAYDFLQQNLSQALPSLRTVRRLVYSEYKPITEGEFRFDELEAYLNKHNAPKVISLGEDATRVVSRVEYDSETDRCVGFVLPSSKNGTLKADSFLAVSFEAIERMFSTATIANYNIMQL